MSRHKLLLCKSTANSDSRGDSDLMEKNNIITFCIIMYVFIAACCMAQYG